MVTGFIVLAGVMLVVAFGYWDGTIGFLGDPNSHHHRPHALVSLIVALASLGIAYVVRPKAA